MKEFDLRLYVVTDRIAARSRSLVDIVEQAIEGGATMVQLREKNAPTDEVIAVGRALHVITKKHGIPLIVNDYVDVALAVDAEGVHVGMSDIPVYWTRRMVGRGKIVGASAVNVAEAIKAMREGADYIGAGPVFKTTTKKDAGEPIGLAGLSAIVKAVSIPVVGIGGITASNVASVMATGAAGIAVISAVVGAAEPGEAAKELSTILSNPKHQILNTK